MTRKQLTRILALFWLIAALALSGCDALIKPVAKRGVAPTPIVVVQAGGTDNPNVFVNASDFQQAMIAALLTNNTDRLQEWMTAPFLAGSWPKALADMTPAEAMQQLSTELPAAAGPLKLIEGADIRTLTGIDPLSLTSGKGRATGAFLISGWGPDGTGQAIMLIAKQVDNSIKWRGWVMVQGRSNAAQPDSIQAYQNDVMGLKFYLPKGYPLPIKEVNEIVILAPGIGEPGENRASAFITAEQANGLSAEQAATQEAEEVKKIMGAGYSGSPIQSLVIDGEQAYSVGHLPGQDFNRQVFVVHGGLLYHLMFMPDSPNAAAYPQMEELYQMVVTTLHFTR